MDLNLKTTAGLLAAARLAGKRGSAISALAAAGLDIPDADQLRALGVPLETILGTEELDAPLIEAISLGYLAGTAAPAPRRRRLHDVTAFLIDDNLVIRAAEGESILRLPWFDQELFIDRQLPDAVEIPKKIRTLAVESYREALGGTATDYAFTSYGHSYTVEAIPIRTGAGRPNFVIAIATPGRSAASAANAVARWAEQMQQTAQEDETRAEEFLSHGHRSSATLALKRAQSARQAADRARRHAERLAAQNAPPPLTPRELDVLTLASHGCSYTEIAQQLVLTAATVKTHLRHCYTKLGVPDKAAAVAVALRHGLIE